MVCFAEGRSSREMSSVYNQQHVEQNMSRFVVSTVSANGLAPLGARVSAGIGQT